MAASRLPCLDDLALLTYRTRPAEHAAEPPTRCCAGFNRSTGPSYKPPTTLAAGHASGDASLPVIVLQFGAACPRNFRRRSLLQLSIAERGTGMRVSKKVWITGLVVAMMAGAVAIFEWNWLRHPLASHMSERL